MNIKEDNSVFILFEYFWLIKRSFIIKKVKIKGCQIDMNTAREAASIWSSSWIMVDELNLIRYSILK